MNVTVRCIMTCVDQCGVASISHHNYISQKSTESQIKPTPKEEGISEGEGAAQGHSSHSSSARSTTAITLGGSRTRFTRALA